NHDGKPDAAFFIGQYLPVLQDLIPTHRFIEDDADLLDGHDNPEDLPGGFRNDLLLDLNDSRGSGFLFRQGVNVVEIEGIAAETKSATGVKSSRGPQPGALFFALDSDQPHAAGPDQG